MKMPRHCEQTPATGMRLQAGICRRLLERALARSQRCGVEAGHSVWATGTGARPGKQEESNPDGSQSCLVFCALFFNNSFDSFFIAWLLSPGICQGAVSGLALPPRGRLGEGFCGGHRAGQRALSGDAGWGLRAAQLHRYTAFLDSNRTLQRC